MCVPMASVCLCLCVATRHSTGAGDYFGAFGEFERDEEDLKRAQEERAKVNPKERVVEKQTKKKKKKNVTRADEL
ncbi:hypothetical protein ATCC90586_011108 [Pythium insidiosum]|nr:hypothetical protein ATCC90586_011108 [Pythium insidiosum]